MHKPLCFASLIHPVCEYVYRCPEQTGAYFTDAVALPEATQPRQCVANLKQQQQKDSQQGLLA